jgi:hypothetical protein
MSSGKRKFHTIVSLFVKKQRSVGKEKERQIRLSLQHDVHSILYIKYYIVYYYSIVAFYIILLRMNYAYLPLSVFPKATTVIYRKTSNKCPLAFICTDDQNPPALIGDPAFIVTAIESRVTYQPTGN